MIFKVLFSIIIFVLSAVLELLITNERTFASRPINIAINLLTYNSAGFGFAPYGPYWKFMKKIVTSELLGDQTLAQLKDIRFDEASQLIHFHLNKAKTRTVVNLSQEVTKEDEQAKEIRSLVRDSTEILAQFNSSYFIGFLRNIDLQGIRKRAKNIHLRYDALIETIMKKREEDEESKICLTRENIKGFMFDLLTTGTDTSGIVVEWAMSELINYPTILEKTIEEIDLVVEENRLVKE
ncbi:hypothetical protein AQUCO_00700721v1 [Aquilegia coerulea]|uniref:Cytochrome P450 n=1 Tax=Aquilegia coerulea TaxID=218851 RepID=A0A2G5ELC0_AQUCA|nr:hypothetical protein AQUCO_00700721v1 [Aquilegia coerulea]